MHAKSRKEGVDKKRDRRKLARPESLSPSGPFKGKGRGLKKDGLKQKIRKIGEQAMTEIRTGKLTSAKIVLRSKPMDN